MGIKPLDNGRATQVAENIIDATFALSPIMEGWKMVSSEIDESGYFITIRWERE